MMDETLHLMTQDNQPYGSGRRCCEMCGIMIWPHPQPTWTDDRSVYDKPPKGYTACYLRGKETGLPRRRSPLPRRRPHQRKRQAAGGTGRDASHPDANHEKRRDGIWGSTGRT